MIDYCHLPEPCKECPASHECWNYAKEPDPANPGGKWKIVGWFDCHCQPASGKGDSPQVPG